MSDYSLSTFNSAGVPIVKKASALLQDIGYEDNAIIILGALFGALIVFALSSIILCVLSRTFGASLWQTLSGAGRLQEPFISASDLTHQTSRRLCASQIALASIPLPEKYDTGNIIVVGAPGSGKTVNIRQVLAQIRSAGRKAVIYDGGGEFISNFYRQGKDILLNPMDSRCADWDIWSDCYRRHDYLRVATALIPDHPGSNEWVGAARIVLARLAEEVADNAAERERRPHLSDLVEQIKTLDSNQVNAIIETTEEAVQMCQWAEKWQQKSFIGIRGILLSCLAPLEELSSSGALFSIRQWIHNESCDSWLFISSSADEEERLRPLVSAWLEIACNGLRSLPVDHLRRFFYVIDDLTSIEPVPSLKKLMTQSKRLGVCSILSLNSVITLLEQYDKETVQSLGRFCETWVVLRSHDFNTAQWLSVKLREYGAIHEHGGAAQDDHGALIAPELIAELTDMKGFIRIGNYPVAKFNSVAQVIPVIAPALMLKKSKEEEAADAQAAADQQAAAQEQEEGSTEPLLNPGLA